MLPYWMHSFATYIIILSYSRGLVQSDIAGHWIIREHFSLFIFLFSKLQVADIIKEDLWPNPLKYFNNVMFFFKIFHFYSSINFLFTMDLIQNSRTKSPSNVLHMGFMIIFVAGGWWRRGFRWRWGWWRGNGDKIVTHMNEPKNLHTWMLVGNIKNQESFLIIQIFFMHKNYVRIKSRACLLIQVRDIKFVALFSKPLNTLSALCSHILLIKYLISFKFWQVILVQMIEQYNKHM